MSTQPKGPPPSTESYALLAGLILYNRTVAEANICYETHRAINKNLSKSTAQQQARTRDCLAADAAGAGAGAVEGVDADDEAGPVGSCLH